MRVISLTLSALALSATSVLAFPAGITEELLHQASTSEKDCPHLSSKRKYANERRATVGFDPVAQKVDVSGVHAFVAPKSSDQRGPCPALNALANHGYIPHSGVVDIPTLIKATNQGMYKKA